MEKTIKSAGHKSKANGNEKKKPDSYQLKRGV